MERKKTLTMNWDALGDDDLEDDRFFETYDRMSSVTPLDLDSSSDDDDDFDDPRASFASAISSVSSAEYRKYASITSAAASTEDYDIWMAAPGSITERRKRLLQGMGLSSHKDMLKIASANNLLARAMSSAKPNRNGEENGGASPENGEAGCGTEEGNSATSQSPFPLVLVRSRSEGDIESLSVDKKRKEEILGRVSKQRLTRTSSMIIVSHARVIFPYQESVRNASPKDNRHRRKRNRTTPSREGGGGEGALTPMVSNSRFGAFVLIKNLDTGKEFIVNEYDQDGVWNRVSDLQTGKQLTLEEFEKCVGHSSVVKELMRRQNFGRGGVDQDGNDRKVNANNYFSKSLRMSKRTGAALIKNIMGVAHSMSTKGGGGAESMFNGSCSVREGGGPSGCNGKEKEAVGSGNGGDQGKQGWVKVRQTGKSHKELSALHLCQEIQAHDGSIWAIRFSLDGKYLASGGEDKVIHVWEVQECEVMSFHEGNLYSHPLGASPSGVLTPGIGEVTPLPSEKKKKKKGSASKRGNPIPEYVHVPETVFSLSEKPICTFTGHLDEVLDLSWSRSQLLLSSSMDKTVRLWNLETKSCLKLFAHNDYVTCIQFNPMDDNHFISGSLDAKVRIWSVPDRQLVDWTDLHEMVTAVCFTPDGQGALIGSHKGSCRMYQVEDSKLSQMERVDLRLKKKSQGKKITGFQFSPANPSEVVVTTADSRIRILDGSEVVHKFKGFRNVNSQLSASFSLDGKYVISASEDSSVYIWKRDEPKTGAPKYKTVKSHESFQCKDISVAVLWPGTVKGDPPLSVLGNSKRNSKRVPTSQPSSVAPSTCSSPTKEDAAARSRRQQSMQSPNASPYREETSSAANSKRQLPPLPKKKDKDTSSDKPPEEDPSHIAYSEPGVGDESFTSSSSSTRYNDPASISASPTPSSSWSNSWSWFDGGNHNHTVQATAWGLVTVTATLNGEIRAYQNFGLPRRIGRL